MGEKAEQKILELLADGFTSKYIINKYMRSKYSDWEINEYRINNLFIKLGDKVVFVSAQDDLVERDPEGEEIELIKDLVDHGICHIDTISNILGVKYKVRVCRQRLVELGLIEKSKQKRSNKKMTDEEYEFAKGLFELGLPVVKYLAIMTSKKFGRKISNHTIKEALSEEFDLSYKNLKVVKKVENMIHEEEEKQEETDF